MDHAQLIVQETPAYFDALGKMVDQKWSAGGRRNDGLAQVAAGC